MGESGRMAKGTSYQRSGGEKLELSKITILQRQMADAYYRIGTYIADNTESKRSDKYVQDQIAKIEKWSMEANELLQNEQPS